MTATIEFINTNYDITVTPIVTEIIVEIAQLGERGRDGIDAKPLIISNLPYLP
jgi:hypothetical protein